MLAQQLKILAGRTAAPWLYLGEAPDADLLIVREPGLDLATGSGLRAQAGSRPSRSGDLHLEWPPRMFALLELLLDAEKRLKVRSASQACAAEQLADLKQDGWLDIGGQRIVLQPRQDRLQASVASLDELLDLLQSSQLDLAAALHLDLPPGNGDAEPFQASLKSVIWALALRSGVQAGRNWNAQSLLFRLSAWPHFDEWAVSPPLLRLAAFYTRQPASIASGCRLAGADEATVRGFLLGCELCQVGVTMNYDKTPPAAPEHVTPPAGGLLQRLRERLGIGFGRKR
ncbi:hypothetical protein KRX52_17340 [Pseudomonas sp. MAP12]|uniref:Uncharacterized protein n=1 Tax=Geopseudomonas aromaticivorans TaxID=2849492 RepID=A0ABS6N0G6_9GAMM|nr:hypothetical protein [Pseudomonas aromaticivorans]MBV2134545.1 hypothetical protein [Pseudomonas aromaticivorans]